MTALSWLGHWRNLVGLAAVGMAAASAQATLTRQLAGDRAAELATLAHFHDLSSHISALTAEIATLTGQEGANQAKVVALVQEVAALQAQLEAHGLSPVVAPAAGQPTRTGGPPAPVSGTATPPPQSRSSSSGSGSAPHHPTTPSHPSCLAPLSGLLCLTTSP